MTLLFNANCIQVYSDAKNAVSRRSKSKGRLSRSREEKSDKKSDALDYGVNTFYFLLGVATQLPVVENVAEAIEVAIEDATKKAKGCTPEKIVKVYKEEIEKSKAKAEAKAAKAITDAANMSSKFKSVLGNDAVAAIDGTTKKGCKDIKEKYKKEMDNDKEKKAYIDKLLKSLGKIIDRKETFKIFDDKSTGISAAFHSGKKAIRKIWDKKPPLLKTGKDASVATANDAIFQKWAADQKTELSKEGAALKVTLDQLLELKDSLPDCSQLTDSPGATKEQKIGISAKAWASFMALNYSYDTCLAGSAGAIIKKFIESGIEKIVEIILDLFTGFVVTAIKVAYYILKAIWFAFKAWKVVEENKEKALFAGKAVGAAARAVLTVFKIGRRRRRARLAKRLNRKFF